MSDERLLRARHLTRLREMLGRLILDEHGARTDHPEVARHLADAVGDLRIVIARLESELSVAVLSDRPSYWEKTSGAVARSEQSDAQPPTRKALNARQMEQRV